MTVFNKRNRMTMKTKKDKTKKGSEPAPKDAEKAGADAQAPQPVDKDQAREGSDVQFAALNDRMLRLQADFDNYRKRTLRQRESERLRANEDLMLELLPILDHLEMGLKTADEHRIPASVRQGFQMVYDQALGSLRKFGLEQIDASDQPFDPHLHESVTLAPSESAPRDHVLAQLRYGYRLGSQLLRPAQVVVSSGPADAEAAETEKTEEAAREGAE